MNHTPGPWKTCGFENLTVNDSEGNTILACPGSSTGTRIEMKGNAALIAAAPELLRELKSAIFYIETYGGDVTTSFSAGGNLDAVKAIITKAEGKE